MPSLKPSLNMFKHHLRGIPATHCMCGVPSCFLLELLEQLLEACVFPSTCIEPTSFSMWVSSLEPNLYLGSLAGPCARRFEHLLRDVMLLFIQWFNSLFLFNGFKVGTSDHLYK